MDNRPNLLSAFLEKNHIADYKIDKIAGDASFRHYFRTTLNDGRSFIIMDAPPEHENIHPFCELAEFLTKNNFSAPKIFASDFENGFLLLEDFGDDSYRKVLEQNNNVEENLYEQAIDLLIRLYNITPPQDLPIYDQNLLLKEVMLFIDWYLPNILKKPASEKQVEQFKEIWSNLFSKLSAPQVLTLRDYHADNLMVLKNKSGACSVGLLDFQDAVIGVPAYDVVSLLTDARRDVSKNLQEKMLRYFLQKSNCNKQQFLLDYQILSLQRNIKIIGIFSRLAVRDGKKQYLNFLPRVFGYVNSAPQNNQLREIKTFLLTFIP